MFALKDKSFLITYGEIATGKELLMGLDMKANEDGIVQSMVSSLFASVHGELQASISCLG